MYNKMLIDENKIIHQISEFELRTLIFGFIEVFSFIDALNINTILFILYKYLIYVM